MVPYQMALRGMQNHAQARSLAQGPRSLTATTTHALLLEPCVVATVRDSPHTGKIALSNPTVLMGEPRIREEGQLPRATQLVSNGVEI